MAGPVVVQEWRLTEQQQAVLHIAATSQSPGEFASQRGGPLDGSYNRTQNFSVHLL